MNYPSAIRRFGVRLLLPSCLLLGAAWPGWAAPAGDLVPERLRVEYQEDPVALDTPRPRLSWWCAPAAAGKRGLRQSAYQVRVASAANLAKADLWDSGKVSSGESTQIAYAGKPLRSQMHCWWQVRVWDQDGRPSPWSRPAQWGMGLLAPTDWKARWIQAPGGGPAAAQGLDGCQWVWTDEPATNGNRYPPGVRYFRKTFALPEGARVAQAAVVMAADNSFILSINGREALRGEGWENVFQADAAGLLSGGANVLAVAATNGGTSPNEAGLVGRLTVRLADGRQITVPVDASWKASDREPAGWQTAGFDDAGWKPARVEGPYGMAPWGKAVATGAGQPLPLFRRSFRAAKAIRRATAYVCGLGQYELHLNGRRVGEDVLDPGWTNYRKTCFYAAYDVTGQVRQGENVLGVMLGNGMYNVTGGRYVKFKGSFGPPKLILQLELEYADGSRETVATDGTWKTAPGPIQFTCIYGGEDYDARKEMAGWDAPGFDDGAWRAAEACDGPGGKLQARYAPPIRAMEELKTVKIMQPRPGLFVYDLGRNFSGWPKLTVQGPAGATVKLTPGELLHGDGTVSQGSSGGPMWFSYTLKGGAPETWQPRFSYYGFRYLQVEGAAPAGDAAAKPDTPRVLDLRGEFLYAAAETAGSFDCANPLVNQIHRLIDAAILSNLKSVLTDCPHREKLGWLEVSHLLAGGIMFNYDVPRFYAKVSQDMREAQLDNGMVPDIAPEYTVFGGGFRDSPEWGSAAVINPWNVWQMYGDRRLLEEHYDEMRRYADYLGSTAKNHIVSHGLGDWYDIGPRGPGESQLTSKGVTATAVWYQDVCVVRDAAALLGKAEDARKYGALADEIRAAFNKAYFHPETNQYDRDSQTANAMPLVLGLVPEERRPAVLESLVRGIRAGGNRVTAGDVGFSYLVRALTDGGRGDVLYDMLCQTNGPGYAMQIAKGATTLTEAWDCNPGSSQNHCMLGHAEEWLYRGLGGICPDPAGPGFRKVILRPQVPAGLAWVKCHYDTPYGRIRSDWSQEAGRLTWNVSVPPNTTATVYVPALRVKESGRPADKAPGVRLLRTEAGATVYAVGSGEYRFEGE